MICPFCGSTLLLERDQDLGEGETGGRAISRTHRCPTCELVLSEARVDKIGSGSEYWSIARHSNVQRVIVRAEARTSTCDSCGGLALVAMPVGHEPAPAWTIEGMTARLFVRADTRCSVCGSAGAWSHG